MDKTTETPTSGDAGELSPAKRMLFELLQARRKDEKAAGRSRPITPADRSMPLPLSFSQQRLWFVDYVDHGNLAYNVPGALRLVGDLSIPALAESLNRIVDRHEVLRTRIVAEQGQPRQVILKKVPLPLPILDLAALEEERREAALAALASLQNLEPYELDRVPLLRVWLVRLSGREHVLLINMHHIVIDTWALNIFMQETMAFYEAGVEGRQAALPPLPIQYADFAVWQRQQLAGDALSGQAEYWREALAGELPILELPTDRPRPAVQTSRGWRHYIELPAEIAAPVRALASRRETTPFVVTLTAFVLLLHRTSRQSELLVGVPVAGRRRSELEALIGLFMNVIVLRADLSAAPDSHQLLDRLQERTVGALEHQDLPFERLVDLLDIPRDLSRSPIYQALFNFQNAPAQSTERAGVAMSAVDVASHTARFDLEAILWEQDGGIRGYLEYNADLFDATTIARLAAAYRQILRRLVRRQEASIRELIELGPSETHQILVEWNDTLSSPLAEASILPRIAARAAERPAADAVLFENARLSYRELDRQANQLAHRLRRSGIGAEAVVGVCMERCPQLVVSLLGILRAGAAWLPLDPEHPDERLRWMIADAGVRLVLAQDGAELPRWGEEEPEVVRLDSAGTALAEEPMSAPHWPVGGAGAAYVIYTSGSTGTPKGVISCHAGLANRLLWMQERYGLTPRDRVLQKTSFTFDVSVWEHFWPLTIGATLVLARPGGHRDPGYLARLIAEREVTTLHFVPSMLRVFLEAPDAARCDRLERAILSGEALPTDLARRFSELLPAAELHNLYGPTEASIDVTAWPWRSPSATGGAEITPGTTVPIGRPIANTRILLLDRAFQPIPIGAAGELLIGGAGLARGYLRRPELTARHFVPDPFSTLAGERLYRTGDLVRRLAGGELEFLQRLDHQIKVRGFRIELGEIETALREHPAIGECVVLADPGPVTARLVACVVPATAGVELGEAELIDDLRATLRERLPEYMVPAIFTVVDSLPRTTSGKIDRKALARHADRRETAARTASIAPRSETERAVVEIWKEVLGVETVGVSDNFFDIGGDSLLLAQVHSKLHAVLGVDLPMVSLFRHTTIRGLTDHLRQDGESEADHQAGTERARTRARLQSQKGSDIAVVSLALRVPGANTPEEFWRNLHDGIESVSFFDDDDPLAAGADPELLAHPDYVRAEAILDDLELFDAAFFGIAPREAELLDPQQRFLLELGWEALERAGYGDARGRGSVGVFVGAAMSSYLYNNLAQFSSVNLMTDFQTRVMVLSGNDKDFHAQKMSYLLKLNGPSVNVQTACSSALVAVHLGIQSLLMGECDMALAGGAQIRVPQKIGYLYQEGGLPSPDGHCRPFDADAMGTLHSNGAGLVVLKRLDDALAAGDPIRAVIKGSAINNDADTKVGFTAPSLEGIARVVAEAQTLSEIDPATLGFLEAHGTGTDLGDTLEVEALTRVFRASTDASQYCYIGSLKGNLGHLDTAAGVISLAKTVLTLEQGQVPPTVNFSRPNPNIDFPATPFKVNARVEDWPRLDGDPPRRAGVNVFAIGGTNVYMVLEEAPPVTTGMASRSWEVLPLSARTGSALAATRDRLAEHLEAHPELALYDVAYTLQVGRKPFEVRQALLCRDRADALAQLSDPASAPRWEGVATGERPAVFLIPDGDDELLAAVSRLQAAEPRLREELDACLEVAGERWSLDLAPGWLDEAPAASGSDVLRARRFAATWALARLWSAWGVVPQAIYGEGVGQLVAACLAGVLPLADALGLAADVLPDGAEAEVLAPPRWPLLSSQSGDWIAPADAADPACWRRPASVEGFARAAETLLGDPDQLLLEVGSGALLRRIRAQAESEPLLASLDAAALGMPPSAVLPSLLGQLWSLGVDLDWAAVRGRDRRRRVELPPYPFEREYFWIDPPVRGARPTPEAETTVGRRPVEEWLYAPVWHAERLSGRGVPSLEPGACWLVASDRSAFAERLAEHLVGAGEEVVILEAGETFGRLDARTFRLRPGHEADVRDLADGLRDAGLRPSRIVHLWTLGLAGETSFEAHQSAGFGSVIHLARGLHTDSNGLEIGVVTAGVQDFGDAGPPCWEKASVLAPVRVLPRELPGLLAWCADLLPPAAGSRSEHRLTEDLLSEFGRGAPVPELVFRGGRRWIRSYERFVPEAGDTLLRDGGTYLVTDGSAGFGLALAEFLAAAGPAKLVLARTTGYDDPEAAARIAVMEEKGSRILAVATDVTDPARMRAVLVQGRERFGRLDGVFHAVAELEEGPRTADEIDGEQLVAQLRPRLEGARVLADLLAEGEPDEVPDFCLLACSLRSLLGGLGTALEGAADSCLDRFAAAAGREGRILWRSVYWDVPDGETSAIGGIAPAEGAVVLRRGLAAEDLSTLVISTADLRRRLEPIQPVEPAAPSRGSQRPRPELETPWAAPGDETEAAIQAIWEEIFGISGIGIDDDFFELGGHSLMATQVTNRLRTTFEIDLPLRDALARPTIRELALTVIERQLDEGDEELDELLSHLEGMTEEEALEISEQV